MYAEKRIYHGLPDLMTKVAREELDELGDDIDECNVMYLPQVITVLHCLGTIKSTHSLLSDNSCI